MTFPLEHVAAFAKAHVESKDIDPVYPVLRELQRVLAPEMQLWHTLTYVAYYNVASAETAWEMGLDRWPWEDELLNTAALTLPTGTERRNLRSAEKMYAHLSSLGDQLVDDLGFVGWLTGGEGYDDLGEPETNWNALDPVLRSVWGNGRWASYKTREVLWKVNDFPLQAPDTGMANSSGPRAGLAIIDGWEWTGLYTNNDPDTVEMLEDAAWGLRDQLAVGYDVKLGIEELETVLCDFHALADGRYYVGHDVDQMLEQAWHPTVANDARNRIFEARTATLPLAYLAEHNVRPQRIDRDRKRAYADTGVILVR